MRMLGVGFCLAVIVANTIGVGLLRTPGEAAAQVPKQVTAFTKYHWLPPA